MKKPRKKPEAPDADAALLQEIVEAMLHAMGRGGLTYFAAKCGLSASNMRKRLKSPEGAFDAPTLRAALLILASKAENAPGIPEQIVHNGRFTIDLHRTEKGDLTPTWKAK